ncbi:hypothetical protein B0H14DRAFT_2574719 [Mycena olivaceomarginata]|nr:hypothetical protein B0H14DRAFT_2574719 [Mycena olivaceomarginata]
MLSDLLTAAPEQLPTATAAEELPMSADLPTTAAPDQQTDLPSPAHQLDALLTDVSALSKLALDIVQRSIDLDDKVVSKLALDLTRHSVAINNQIPQVVRSHVDAIMANIRHTLSSLYHSLSPVDTLSAARVFYQDIAPTPAKLDALFPPGQGDNKAYHVVCVGRVPGLYETVEEANEQIDGVPTQSRRRVVGRLSALAYYRQMFDAKKVLALTQDLP